MKNKKGFTLIEMLIVIVIIGILAAAIIPRLNSARGRANDVARKADLNQVATALITYQLDNGFFPGGDSGGTGVTIDKITAELIAGGMTSIPRDPANNQTFSGIDNIAAGVDSPYYLYTTISKGGMNHGGFVLMAKMESHGQANYVVCDGGPIIFQNTLYDNINLCTRINATTNNSECSGASSGDNYNCTGTLDQLRYIYKY